MNILKIILNIDDHTAEYLDQYWQGNGQYDMNMYGTCRKRHKDMVLAYFTGKFPATHLSKYKPMILKKLGYTLGSVEGRKVLNYCKKHNISYPPIHLMYLFFSLAEASPITAINIPKNNNIRRLFEILQSLELIRPSKYYQENYYSIKRNKKLWSIFAFFNADILNDEFLYMKKIGEANYINNACEKIYLAANKQNYQHLSIEQCLLVGFILRIITRRFKMKSLASKKHVMNYVSKLQGVENKKKIAAILNEVIQLPYIHDIAKQNLYKHSKKCLVSAAY